MTVRRALVTGSNRGLGLEVVRQLAQRGLRVLLGARDAHKGEAAHASLPYEVRTRVSVVELDVAGDALEAQLAAHGPIDVLVNNAAVHYDTWQTASRAELQVVREALDTNLLGAWRAANAVIPHMRARRWGRIVNVSSGAGALDSLGAGTPAYSVSKAALNALTLCLARELLDSGILINAVCPGWVATDMGGAGGRPVSEGAAGIVWAATLPDDGPSGGFFRDRRLIPW
jgi:NAD(P)-dependent dehydrogenase (short-subunit alcohol dehydrogenase family)